MFDVTYFNKWNPNIDRERKNPHLYKIGSLGQQGVLVAMNSKFINLRYVPTEVQDS